MNTYNISEFIKYLNIDGAKNNAIQIIKYDEHQNIRVKSESVLIDFYMFAVKSDIESDIDYGQTAYDENNTFLYMDKPKSEIQWDVKRPFSGYNLLIEPKLFNRSALGEVFPNYNAHDALFLTKDEELLLKDIYEKAYLENSKSMPSTEILVSYTRLILSYAKTFYTRQFETRRKIYNKIVADFYQNLESYYANSDEFMELPNVAYFAEKSNHSANYFGDVIKHFTDKSPLEIIHEHIITIAKNRLRNSDLTVSQIGYSLGFEYPTYFTRFFKNKTGVTPNNFRNQ